VFSDLHLGHRAGRIESVAALRPLFEGAGTVVFNGDTWQEMTRCVRQRSAEMLQELESLCASLGCETVFLSGNHDPGWPGPGWLGLAGGRIVITHGDALMFEGSPWRREILTNAPKVLELWARHPAAGEDIGARLRVARAIARTLPSQDQPHGKRLWQRAWDAVTPPRRALRMLEAWCCQGSLANTFCDRYFPSAEVLVIGHFHRHGLWQRGSRLIINTGSFVNPGHAHWVEWHDGRLRRGVIVETPARCSPGEVLDVWRFPETDAI
jgi:predicted phosphodiesterase